MTSQERLMLATLKGAADGYVDIAKAYVRAHFETYPDGISLYSNGFRDACRAKAVEHLRAMRSIQRIVHEYCKGVGYHV